MKRSGYYPPIFAILLIITVVGIIVSLLKTTPTKEQTQNNLGLIDSMIYTKKDGHCFGVIVSYTYYGYKTIAVTHVPMELCND